MGFRDKDLSDFEEFGLTPEDIRKATPPDSYQFIIVGVSQLPPGPFQEAILEAIVDEVIRFGGGNPGDIPPMAREILKLSFKYPDTVGREITEAQMEMMRQEKAMGLDPLRHSPLLRGGSGQKEEPLAPERGPESKYELPTFDPAAFGSTEEPEEQPSEEEKS